MLLLMVKILEIFSCKKPAELPGLLGGISLVTAELNLTLIAERLTNLSYHTKSMNTL